MIMFRKPKRKAPILWVLFISLMGGGAYLGHLFWHRQVPSLPLQVLVIRWEELWENLPEMEALKRKLNKKLESYHREFSDLEIQLRNENQGLAESQKSVNFKDSSQTKIFADRQKKFSEKVMKTQQEAERRQKELQEHHEESMRILREKINEAIKKVAHKHEADLVISQNQTSYYDPKLDITNEVLSLLKTEKES